MCEGEQLSALARAARSRSAGCGLGSSCARAAVTASVTIALSSSGETTATGCMRFKLTGAASVRPRPGSNLRVSSRPLACRHQTESEL